MHPHSAIHLLYSYIAMKILLKIFKTQGSPPFLSVYVCALHCGGPGFGSWARTWHHSSGHIEVASHIPKLEGPAIKIYSYVQEGFGEIKQKKKRKKKRLATVVSPGANL